MCEPCRERSFSAGFSACGCSRQCHAPDMKVALCGNLTDFVEAARNHGAIGERLFAPSRQERSGDQERFGNLTGEA